MGSCGSIVFIDKVIVCLKLNTTGLGLNILVFFPKYCGQEE